MINNTDSLKMIEITPGTIFFSNISRAVSFESQGVDSRTLAKNNIPNPTSVDWEGTVIANQEKNAKGDLFLEYVNKKRKVTVGWQFLTQQQYKSLLDLLCINFNDKHQPILYYKIKSLNPNDAFYQAENGKLQPQLAEMDAYLEGKYTGKVVVYHTPQEVDVLSDSPSKQAMPLMIGYEGVSLVFLER
ncbi:MAG: hypothetical protein FWH03_00185 [Firmicutes bacterium]|nr:hypothetical protein [Bacillota bacterium]